MQHKSSNKKLKKKPKLKSKVVGKKKHTPKTIVKEPGVIYSAIKYIESKKSFDDSWDFKRANTKEYTHCFHSYPAMMIPQVARRILETYGKKATLLFDPYCGTGTSLVEANLKGINAIGTDINPLARLIATTKTSKIDIQVLDLFLRNFSDYFFYVNFSEEGKQPNTLPKIKNIDFWFSKAVQIKLTQLLVYINNIKDLPIRNFFKVAFSETVRECSYSKTSEFKLVRRKNFQEIDEPDVFAKMIQKLKRNRQGLIDFEGNSNGKATTIIYDFNSVSTVPKHLIPDKSIDIIVTSPPYGDSRTTVAYGQYSRLSSEWLGYENASKVDSILMGGERRKHNHIFNSDILNDIILKIQNQDKARVRDVISFYEDYEMSINNISNTIKNKGFACFVVGNRTVKGIKIPTDEITVQLFEKNNFTHIETIIRNIPNKRMPSKNSPSNIIGETSSTMKNEYIIICQRN